MKYQIKRNSLLTSDILQNFKQVKRKTPEVLHFRFPVSCRIASVTSYLSETRLKIYKTATSILLKFEVSDGSFFGIFTLFHFELNFFRLEFPFKTIFISATPKFAIKYFSVFNQICSKGEMC